MTQFCNKHIRHNQGDLTGHRGKIKFISQTYVSPPRIPNWPRRIDTLHWRHDDHDDVSNHQPHGCLLNRVFRRRSKKISKLRVTGLCAGNSPGPVNSLHKGPVTRKMFPFDDVIMRFLLGTGILSLNYTQCTVGSLKTAIIGYRKNVFLPRTGILIQHKSVSLTLWNNLGSKQAPSVMFTLIWTYNAGHL